MATYLVISGGGAHGAFAVGAIKALRAAGMRFDGVVGTSTGALIAPLIATDEIGILEDLYTGITNKDILRWWPWNLLMQHAWYSTKPLWKLIRRHITPERYQRILDAPVAVWLATVSLQSGKVSYWNPRSSGADGGPMSHEAFMHAMLASSNQPVLMPVVPMPDGMQHVDGGVREVAPLRQAIEQGAEEIYAIVLSPAKRHPQQGAYASALKIGIRTLDLFLTEIVANDVHVAEIYNQALGYVEHLRTQVAQHLPEDMVREIFASSPFADKRLLSLHVLRPDEELPGDGLTFEPEAMRAMVALGEQIAQRYLKEDGVALA
jgi:NTE family protein